MCKLVTVGQVLIEKDQRGKWWPRDAKKDQHVEQEGIFKSGVYDLEIGFYKVSNGPGLGEISSASAKVHVILDGTNTVVEFPYTTGPIETLLRLVKDQGGEVHIVRDVTARVRLNHKLQIQKSKPDQVFLMEL